MKKFLLSVAVMILIAAMSLASGEAAQKIIEIKDSARWEQSSNVNKFPAEVLRLVNVERAKHGLIPLKFANDLASSAMIRAKELPKKFSHTRPNGTKCFTAMPKRGHILGENLAGGQTTPKQVVQAWMDSPSHRANILGSEYRELGVVYYYNPDSKFKHYWVQHFRG